MCKLHILFLVLVTFNSIAYGGQAAHANEDNTLHISPEINGVSLESEGSLYWLHFDADADSLWPMLKDFWATEDIALKSEQPLLGFMETEWIKNMETNALLTILLSDQAPVRRERFRIRVERLPGDKGTRVFINHSGYGILLKDEAVYTGYLPTSPELEIEMLSRLALYSGAEAEQASQIISSFSTAPSQVKQISKDQYEISIPGSVEFVRKKLVRALDRMDMDIKTETNETIIVKVTNNSKLEGADDPADWDIDDDSDLEEQGFSDYISKTAGKNSKPDNIIYLLGLIADESRVTISINSHADNTGNGMGLTRFSQSLARNLQAK